MAQRVQTIMTSDLSGVDIPEGDGTTINFSLYGVEYEMDVTSKEAQQFDMDMQNYVAAARRVGGRLQRGAGTGARTRRDPSQTQQIKKWAQEQGLDFPQRGRLPQSLIDQYEAAH